MYQAGSFLGMQHRPPPTRPIHRPRGLPNSKPSAVRGLAWNGPRPIAEPPHGRPPPMQSHRRWRIKMTLNQDNLSSPDMQHHTININNHKTPHMAPKPIMHRRYNTAWQQPPRRWTTNHHHFPAQARGSHIHRPSITRYQPSARFSGLQNPFTRRPRPPTEWEEKRFMQQWRPVMNPHHQPLTVV